MNNTYIYRAFRSDWYYEKFQKLDTGEQNRILKIVEGLKENPFTGKPLGYRFLREKKLNGKRLIFLVYEEHHILFLVTITDKKAQQSTIDMIKANLDVYKEEIQNVIERLKNQTS